MSYGGENNDQSDEAKPGEFEEESSYSLRASAAVQFSLLLFEFLLLVGQFCIAVRDLLFQFSLLSVVFVKRNLTTKYYSLQKDEKLAKVALFDLTYYLSVCYSGACYFQSYTKFHLTFYPAQTTLKGR